ncbi:MAG: ABC transporter ATP-binding protein [Planctomycetota bacterium]|nr:ABC transporter ATP-binding protein [Planctomycetota bacterium]
MSRISLENVSKTYAKKVFALRELDLQVHDGEYMVLVGPSGCGKTTLLRVIAGLEKPDEGEIKLGEKIITNLAPARRQVAMIFQEFSLYPHLTVRKNLTYPLKLRQASRSDPMNKKQLVTRLEWVIELTRIREFLSRKPGELSGGQRQRVALAAALVRKALCHLLDEPLSDLDVVARRQLRMEMKSLHRETAITTLHVTHDQEEAMSLGDRIAVMRRGRIHQVGTPMQLYREPEDRFVAGFMGTPPMNFIEGHLQTEGDRLLFRDGHGLEFSPSEAQCKQFGRPRQREVVWGVRPVDLKVVSETEAPQSSFRAKVEFVEPLGEHIHIHARTAQGAALLASVPSENGQPKHGESLTFAFDCERIHLFESGEAGLRIS